MKKLFSTLFVVFFATSMMAQTGLTCDDPISVNNDYKATIDGPCELWYTADTYDLPLDLRFYPNSSNSTWGPEVEIDFTCVEGVYDDPKLDSLVNMVSDFNITFPIELISELVPGANGKNEFHLSVSKSYREQLADFGITYPVQAFVKVRYFEGGTIGFEPDTTFSSCMENADYVNLGDTFDIVANDTERAFVFPFTEWQEDSIRFVWTGAEPAQVYVAVQECSFVPSLDDPFVWKNFAVAQDTPYKLYSEGMKADIKEQKEGGVYYAKVIAQGAGQLVVEKIPMSTIDATAQLLEYGQSLSINTESNQLYCFPRTWTATEFKASTTGEVKLYVSNVADFSASVDDPNLLTTYDLDIVNGARLLQLSTQEMNVLTSYAQGDYIYVRMVAANPTVLTINEWTASDCADNSTLIRANVEKYVAAKSFETVYRLRYSDYSGYPITLIWSGNSTLPTYLAEDCNISLNTNADNYLINPAPVLNRRGTLKIEAAEVDSWASRVSGDGFIYVVFNPSNGGRVTFQTDKPADETPVIPDPIYDTITATLCFGETYEWNGQTYNETGKYTQTFPAANGADSIVTLNLTVLPEVPVTKEIAAVCYGETYTWQGQEYTESGEYSVTLQDVNGCDSVITLAFIVYPQTPDTTEEVTIKFGESYEWNGQTYSTAGEYTITLQDANGCDYQATLILTVLPEEDGTILLNPTDELVLNLDSAVNVYRTDYDVWSASKVQLDWYGDKPLHVFVSKEKDFFVAIYHEDVVLYQKIDAVDSSSVEPQVLVLDMSALRAYVNDGKLYVRFLTDSDARLVIEPLTE